MRVRFTTSCFTGSLLAVLCLGLATFCATPAAARLVAVHLPFKLAPPGSPKPSFIPNAIAIDQTTGNVYVTDHATDTVKVFGGEGGPPPAGVPAEVAGGETPAGAFAFGGSEEPAGIAVDNSGGVNAGDVYVGDTEHNVVDMFKLEAGEYRYVCQFTGFMNVGDSCQPNELGKGETHPGEPFGGVGGVAVDSHGDVYVATFEPHRVYEFNAAGEDVGHTTAIPSGEPSGLAVDSSGVVYVQDYQGSVFKLTPSFPGEFEVEELDSERSRAVAVDPATNDVYVDHKDHIVVLEPPEGTSPGAVIREIRPEGEFASEGVAVNDVAGPLKGDVYLSNTLSESVEAFGFVTVPEGRLPRPPEVGPESAKLYGEIDPEGTSGAKFHYEYGLPGTLGFSTPEEEVPAVNGYGLADAELTGLLPNTEYGYRLLIAASSGLLEKTAEGTFTTLRRGPQALAVEAIDVTATSAIFSGEVNPENSPPATYHFEYGAAPNCNESSLPTIDIGASANPVPVEQMLPEGIKLRPSTEYCLQLVAENHLSESEVATAESTAISFITPTAPTTSREEPPTLAITEPVLPPPATIAQPATLPILATPNFPVVKYPKTVTKHHSGRHKPKPRGKHRKGKRK
jgi:DNA-binding beta-propeller fold protein YncE